MTNQYLEELSQRQGVDFRANVPEGTVLGEEQIEPGAKAVYRKNKSMMRAGNVPLPDREPLYDLVRHDVSLVPATIAQKRMTTHPGRFTTLKPHDWDENQPQPIDETCAICEADPERLANPLAEKRPKFYRQSDLTLHYQLFHTMEWQAIQDDRRDRERREDQGQMRALLGAIVALVKPDAVAGLPADVRDQIERLQDAEPPTGSYEAMSNSQLRSLLESRGIGAGWPEYKWRAQSKAKLIALLEGGD